MNLLTQQETHSSSIDQNWSRSTYPPIQVREDNPHSLNSMEDYEEIDIAYGTLRQESLFDIDVSHLIPLNQKNSSHSPFCNRIHLEQNMETAELINSYVNEAVPFSTNNHLRGGLYHQEQSLDVIREIDARHSFICMVNKSVIILKEAYRGIAQITETLKVGNCFELSVVGFTYALDNLGTSNIEIFQIAKGNHAFLVIDRDLRSSPEKFLDWGRSCVVCDPWAGIYYPSFEILTKLQDYTGGYLANNRYIPSLAPFNPHYQNLEIMLSSSVF